MNKIINTNNLIQKFLNHELNQEELIVFKKKWAENPEFVKEIQDYTNLIITLKALNRSNNLNKRKPANRSLYKHPTILAIIIICLFITPMYYIIKSPSPINLAQKNLIGYRLSPTRGDKEESELTPVIRAYHNKQIPKAISLMKKIKNKNNDVYFFTLADLFVKANQPDKALYYYQKGSLLNNSDPYTQWNSALARLQKGDYKTVKKILSQMIVSKHAPYDQKAKTLLKTMNTLSFRIKSLFY